MFKQEKCIPCQGGVPPLADDEIRRYQKLINPDWLVDASTKLLKEFKFESYGEAIKFTNLVANLAEEQAHHPYIHVNFRTVKVILFTHKINGLHENDFLMAKKIDNLEIK